MHFNEHSVDGVALLLWAAAPEQPELLATPFFHAAAAAAMDLPVELYFTARSVLLLKPGVAEGLRPGSHPKTVLQSMQEAHELGVKFLVCTDALRAHGLADTPLIAECGGRGGAVQFMARAADRRWRTLVF